MASVSEPAKARSQMRIASSAPMARASRRACSACGGPMVMTVTFPPYFSTSWMPASMAFSSKGLMMLGTPSRTSVPVVGSIRTSVVSGTCLIETMMFIRWVRECVSLHPLPCKGRG